MLLLIGAAGGLYWGLIGQVESTSPLPGDQHAVAVPVVSSLRTMPPVDQFAHIWQTNVRQSLTASDIPATDPALTMAASSFRARLMATAVSGTQSYAVFLDPQLSWVVRKVNQEVDGARVVSIERTKVTLEQQGRILELSLPETSNGGGQ